MAGRGKASKRLLELHYTPAELSVAFRQSKKTIRAWIRAGKFGPLEQILKPSETELLVPTSGVSFFYANSAIALQKEDGDAES